MGAPARRALRGRGGERRRLDTLLDEIRSGNSCALVLRGEAGVGKTELVRYCARQASGCRIVEITGVESELEMPFAALHRLYEPVAAHTDALPEPQREVLQVAFGLRSGKPPDRFVMGLAVLNLFAEASTETPLLCLVDDAQWLDEPSAQVLGFVARRLHAEPIGMLFSVRDVGPTPAFDGLETLGIRGLNDSDARALLAASVPGPVDDLVRDRLILEARGNPLALLELPRTMSPAELAGGYPLAVGLSDPSRLGEHYRKWIRKLPAETRRLMLLAAADPTGDATLVARAAKSFEISNVPAAAARSENLLEIGGTVRFRHPLVRSAAYASGKAEERLSAHRAMAAATDNTADPERRVWHLAAAASGPDDELAVEVEAMATTAQERAGLAAAAAFLERAYRLTADPTRLADRALAAATAHLHAGSFDAALALLAEARATAVEDLQLARAERLRGRIAWASNPGREAPMVLMNAAKRLESLDTTLARETYLDAWIASFAAGPLAEPGGDLHQVSVAARSVVPATTVRVSDFFLDGLTRVVTEGRSSAAPPLRAAISFFLDEADVGQVDAGQVDAGQVDAGQVDVEAWMEFGHLVVTGACLLWDHHSWDALSQRHVEVARASGALKPLSIALNGRAVFTAWAGDFPATAAVLSEESIVNEVTGIQQISYGSLFLAAYQGNVEEALPYFTGVIDGATVRGEGQGVAFTRWVRAILLNGASRYGEALETARQAIAASVTEPAITGWALPELIEAAVRTGDLSSAHDAVVDLSNLTEFDGAGDWGLALLARSRALTTAGDRAERYFQEAVERFEHTALKTELARSHLLYGEWLRRANRRSDAREQLRSAHELFTAIGAEAFAARTRHELVATGAKVRKHDAEPFSHLTAQEEHIARLARDGRSNPEIAAALFLSTRTVEWHMRKVFIKLGITSRRGLLDALRDLDPVG